MRGGAGTSRRGKENKPAVEKEKVPDRKDRSLWGPT